MQNLPVPQQQTMSSREIAELVESRHDSVKRTIERCAERGTFTLPPLVETSFKGSDGRGQTASVYNLDKRSSLIVVAQLSPEFTARIVDRWQELEAQSAIPAPQQAPVPLTQAARDFKALFGVARLLGMDKNASAISANQAVAKVTGTNMLQLLGAAHLESAQQVLFFTPTDLGKIIGVGPRKMNLLLAEAGLQAKRGEHWTPLEAAEGFCRIMDTGKRHGDGTMIQQVKWADGVLALVQKAA